jgi:sphinganine C4-monooxygenase
VVFRERRRPVEMVPWEGYVSDETMGTFSPIVLYWLYAGGYQLILHRRPLERYRLHTRDEEEEKNLVSLSTVVRGVLLQQLVQAIVAMILFMVRRQSALVNCRF